MKVELHKQKAWALQWYSKNPHLDRNLVGVSHFTLDSHPSQDGNHVALFSSRRQARDAVRAKRKGITTKFAREYWKMKPIRVDVCIEVEQARSKT